MAIDVVCRMTVNEKSALKAEYNGKEYHFCSPGCQQAFKNNPAKFIK